MYKHNLNRQSGSVHVIIIIVLVVAVIGALGFVFWKNFINTPSTSTKVESSNIARAPKSEIIAITNSDMNKYINHDKGFEFLFPKEIYGDNGCAASTTVFDRFGATVTTEQHYGVASGVTQMTVLESDDNYIITSKNTVVLSNPKKIGLGVDENSIYMACETKDTTVDLINSANKGSLSPNISTQNRTFQVTTASSEKDVLHFARQLFDDPTGTITWTNDASQTRKDITFVITPDSDRVGGYAYKIWYYEAEKKLVYFAIGQSVAFAHPDNSNNYYLDRIVDSFKLSTK